MSREEGLFGRKEKIFPLRANLLPDADTNHRISEVHPLLRLLSARISGCAWSGVRRQYGVIMSMMAEVLERVRKMRGNEPDGIVFRRPTGMDVSDILVCAREKRKPSAHRPDDSSNVLHRSVDVANQYG
jgi:hypothetical protein